MIVSKRRGVLLSGVEMRNGQRCVWASCNLLRDGPACLCFDVSARAYAAACMILYDLR